MSIRLDAERVRKLFEYCLFLTEEDKTKYVAAEGITNNVGFHPGRLEESKAEIEALLDELPESFKDGMSFLQACMDKHGNHWGEHQNMEQLFLLGLAVGKAKLLMPRMLWSALPGGMPYYAVK